VTRVSDSQRTDARGCGEQSNVRFGSACSVASKVHGAAQGTFPPTSGGAFGRGEVKKRVHRFSLSPTDSLGCSFGFMLVHSELGSLPSAGPKPGYKPTSSFTASAYVGSDGHPCQYQQWY